MSRRKPNPITIGDYTDQVPKKDFLGFDTNQTMTRTRPIKLIPKSDKKTLNEFKNLREWLDRAIEWGEKRQKD